MEDAQLYFDYLRQGSGLVILSPRQKKPQLSPGPQVSDVRQRLPLRKPQLPEGRPQAPDRLTVGLLIHLLGFELGLQLLHFWAVLPLTPASAAVQLDPAGELVAAFASGGQQVEQIPPQMGEPQGVVQLFCSAAS